MFRIAKYERTKRKTVMYRRLVMLIIATGCSTAWGQYHLIELGDLPDGYEFATAYDMNNHGEITGFLRPTQGGSQAFIWDRANGFQMIPHVLSSDPFGAGMGINDLGQVVGFSSSTDQGISSRAFVWDRVSGVQELLAPDGTIVTMAEQINNQGTIIGTSRIPSDTSVSGMRAVIWDNTPNGSFLGNLTIDDPASPAAINNLGQVAGTNNNGAFIWDQVNGFRDLGKLNPDVSHLHQMGINDAGQVVGTEALFSGGHIAFIWDEDSGIRALSSTPLASNASDINAAGQVVGAYFADNADHPFVWDTENGLRDLADLVDESAAGWILGPASAINDKGWIMGRGVAPDGTSRMYLLIPEPATLVLLTLAGLALRRR